MPREPRDFSIGEIYHVINRGVDRREIFSKAQDYSRFILGLELFNSDKPVNIWQQLGFGTAGSDLAVQLHDIRRRKNRPIVELSAFALMPNHYHLIIREIEADGIVKYMQKLGGYSLYYNKQCNRVGPLFQSRYKAILQTGDVQLANLFSYVHTNPVELIEPGWKDEFKVQNSAKAIEFVKSYPWSSYQDYLGTGRHRSVTNQRFFLDYLGGEKGCKKNVEEWIKFKAQITAGSDLAVG